MPRVVADEVSIANMALRHLGQSQGIVALTDASEAADAVNAFFDNVVDEVLRDFPWSFCRTFASLPLFAGPNPPATVEWAYSYRLPSDCIHVRRILPYAVATPANVFSGPIAFPPGLATAPGRVDMRNSRIPYILGQDAQGALLFTDFPPVAPTASMPALPQIEYTAQNDIQSRWPADFVQMIALLLAFYIAPQVTKGDPFKLGQRAQGLYDWARQRAQNNDANEGQPDMPADAEWITAR